MEGRGTTYFSPMYCIAAQAPAMSAPGLHKRGQAHPINSLDGLPRTRKTWAGVHATYTNTVSNRNSENDHDMPGHVEVT